jgi:hypothetical protein
MNKFLPILYNITAISKNQNQQNPPFCAVTIGKTARKITIMCSQFYDYQSGTSDNAFFLTAVFYN